MKRSLTLAVILASVLGCSEPKQSVTPNAVPPSVSSAIPETSNASTLPTFASNPEHVHYHNPSTGTDSDYELEIERGLDGKVERIDFPNGGWKEVDGQGIDNGDGTETFTDSRGYEYTVGGTAPTEGPAPATDPDKPPDGE